MRLEALWVGAGNYTVSPRLRARFPVPVPIEIHPNKEHLVVEAATPLKDLEVGLPEPCKSQKLSPYLVKLLASPVSVSCPVASDPSIRELFAQLLFGSRPVSTMQRIRQRRRAQRT